MNIPGAFTDIDVLFKRHTEKALVIDATAGFQTALLGQIPPDANTATNLVGATTYTATVKVDGTNRAVSILGSAAATYGTLISEINADIGTWALAELISTGIRITSLSTGTGSSVAITDTTLFAGLTKHFQGFRNAVPGKNVYLRWTILDEDSKLNVKTVMDTVDNTATAWAPGKDGFRVAGVNAFTALGIAAGTYDLNLSVNGASAVNVPFAVTAGMTYQQLVDDAISPAVTSAGLACTVAFVTDSVVFTTTGIGNAVSVVLTAGTNADVIAALSATNLSAGTQVVNVGGAKVGTDTTSLVGGTTYTATITVDGVAKAISILGSAASTYATLINELNADLGNAANASLTGGNILITSATLGSTSTVAITAGTLFAAPLAGFVAVVAASTGTSSAGVSGLSTMTFPKTVAGIVHANWKSILMTVKGLNGYGPYFVCPNKSLVSKGPKPAARGECVETALYFDGTNWKYFSNDVTVDPNSVNPPES